MYHLRQKFSDIETLFKDCVTKNLTKIFIFHTAMKLKIKKGDTVRILAGNDKGKEGRVIELLPEKMRIVVEGINVRKRHMRPSPNAQQGQIIEREMPIHYSNVMLLDGAGKTTRLGVKVVEQNGEKSRVRIARTTGEEV